MARCILLILLLAFCAPDTGTAQIFIRRHAHSQNHAPSALIVLLPGYNSRVRHLRGSGETSLLNMLEQDRKEIWERMRADFARYFDYCPVYFAADTNADALVQGQFAGILLDSNLAPLQSSPIPAGDTTFMIGAYGYRSRDRDEYRLESSGEEVRRVFNGDTEAQRPSFTLHNHHLQQLERPEPRQPSHRLGLYSTAQLNARCSRYMRHKLGYTSRKFDISYKASAAIVSIVLRQFYGPYPYSKS